MIISIAGLSKAKVLAALYNASAPLGMGFLHYDRTPMTEEVAEDILKDQTYFDYLKGRVMKLDLASDDVEVGLYDRDNGAGAAKQVIDLLRQPNADAFSLNAPDIQEMHMGNKAKAMEDAEKLSYSKSSRTDGVFTLGADELGGPLREAIKKNRK